jgi:hypothetical protein
MEEINKKKRERKETKKDIGKLEVGRVNIRRTVYIPTISHHIAVQHWYLRTAMCGCAEQKAIGDETVAVAIHTVRRTRSSRWKIPEYWKRTNIIPSQISTSLRCKTANLALSYFQSH